MRASSRLLHASRANLSLRVCASSPSEIGRYGMGSRSYFHYSDVTTVLSRGLYVGVDPLEVVQSNDRNCGRDRGGWKCNVATPTKDPNHRACVQEARALFDCGVPDTDQLFASEGKGAAFRLPLRRANEVTKDGFGLDISPAAAEKFLESWVQKLANGKVLLFLTSVTRVSIWIWRAGEGKPSRLTCVSKSVQHRSRGSAFSRLPPTLPSAARESYEGLSKHVSGLNESERKQLSAIHFDQVVINVESSGQSTRTEWLVCQRFDA